jgi:hypothetical protein
MSIPDIIEIDLPTIIVLIVLWLLDWMGIRKLTQTVEDMRTRLGR